MPERRGAILCVVNTGSITVERFYTDVGNALGLKLLAGAGGLKRLIREPTVNRPGLALTGFRQYFAPKRVQVLGSVETAYLRSLSREVCEQRIREFFRYRIPCVVLCRDIKPGRLLAAAEVTGRVGLGCELDPRYVSLIVDRMEKLGCKAERRSTP